MSSLVWECLRLSTNTAESWLTKWAIRRYHQFSASAVELLSTRRSTLVLGGEYNRTLVSTLLAQLALC
jgi:hypothetical protein